MEVKQINQKFRKYITSSMITMFLQGTYSLIDGIFVSNVIGGTALAAINVAWPIIAVINAIGTGCGCGGAVMMSMKQGQGKQEESDKIRANTIILLTGLGCMQLLLFQVLLIPLLKLMGCNGEMLRLAVLYGRMMILGGLVQTMACGLSPILRNDNKAVTSMVIVVTGLVIHISFGVIFIYFLKMGITGSALASITGEGFTAICSFIVLCTKKSHPLRLNQFRLEPAYWKKIIQIGVSPFGISLTPSLLILWHNIATLSTGRDEIVTAFALITSTVGAYRILLIGVAEGTQPLASYFYGAGDIKSLIYIRNKSVRLAYIVSSILFLFTIATARLYPGVFGYDDPDLVKICERAIILTAPQLIFTGMVRVSNSFFYSVGKNLYSLIMIYLDPILMTPVALFILMKFFGVDGIWANAVVTQLILNIIAIWMMIHHGREIRRGWDEDNCYSGESGAARLECE